MHIFSPHLGLMVISMTGYNSDAEAGGISWRFSASQITSIYHFNHINQSQGFQIGENITDSTTHPSFQYELMKLDPVIVVLVWILWLDSQFKPVVKKPNLFQVTAGVEKMRNASPTENNENIFESLVGFFFLFFFICCAN